MELNEVRVTIRKNAEGLRFCHDIRCCVSLMNPLGEEVERKATITISDRILDDVSSFACLLMHTIRGLLPDPADPFTLLDPIDPSTLLDRIEVTNRWVQ